MLKYYKSKRNIARQFCLCPFKDLSKLQQIHIGFAFFNKRPSESWKSIMLLHSEVSCQVYGFGKNNHFNNTGLVWIANRQCCDLQSAL